jgi:hypothetical protein
MANKKTGRSLQKETNKMMIPEMRITANSIGGAS